MAVSSTMVMLLLSLVLFTQALEQWSPLGRRSKRDVIASMASFFGNVERRLAALEDSWDNSTEERLTARLEAKMEGKMKEKQQEVEEKQQDVEEKLEDVEEKQQVMQDGLQRLESMFQELLSSRLESIVTEILTSKMKASEQKVAEMVAKTNATEDRLASLEVSKTEAQSSPASCRYQYLYQYEKEAPYTSGDLHRMAKLESELTRLQEKVSSSDKLLQDNDLNVGSRHNASMLAMEVIVHSMTELVAASEQSLKSTMENATKFLYENIATTMNTTFFTSMRSDSEARLLTRAENNATVFNNSIARVEQTIKHLATRMSAVEGKLENAKSLHTEVTEITRAMLEDVKSTTKETCRPPQYKRTCQDYYDNGQTISGIYSLELEDGQGPIEVYCDMQNGTGWVVFQRREDGSIDFFRDWKNYKEGFGDLLGEFWLGNRNIHRLTSAGLTQLRVDLQARNSSTAFASYANFSVGDVISSYTLSVSGYSGTAGDCLGSNSGHKFSTFDRDEDAWTDGNCAQDYKGAWWYGGCTYCNLNGEYSTRNYNGRQCVTWYNWLGLQSLQRTELKLK